MIDFPGHGQNIVMPEVEISFDSFTHLTTDLLDHLGVTDAVFAGISMGSAVSLCCAAARPDLVRRVVAIRPAWIASPAPDHLALIDRCGTWLSTLPLEQAFKALEADPEYNEMRAEVPLAAASVRAALEREHAALHAPVLSAMFHDAPFNSLSALRNIEQPVTVVGNLGDNFHPLSIAKATANALPNAELRILPPRYLQPEKHQAAVATLILEQIGVAT